MICFAISEGFTTESACRKMLAATEEVTFFSYIWYIVQEIQWVLLMNTAHTASMCNYRIAFVLLTVNLKVFLRAPLLHNRSSK